MDADGLWSTGSNWTNGRPNSIGATANLTSAITGPHAVTVDGPQTVGNIVFTNANAYTVTGGAADIITLNNGLGTATLSATSGSHSLNAPLALVNPSAVNADAGASLSIGGDISGAAGLTKIGNGTVSLAGTNSYTTTTVSAGTLQVGAGGSTGSLGSGAASIGVGATLAFNRNNAFTVSNNLSGVGTLFHEAMHSFVNAELKGGQAPSWLNEGFAALFEQGRVVEGKWIYGNPNPWREKEFRPEFEAYVKGQAPARADYRAQHPRGTH